MTVADGGSALEAQAILSVKISQRHSTITMDLPSWPEHIN